MTGLQYLAASAAQWLWLAKAHNPFCWRKQIASFPSLPVSLVVEHSTVTNMSSAQYSPYKAHLKLSCVLS